MEEQIADVDIVRKTCEDEVAEKLPKVGDWERARSRKKARPKGLDHFLLVPRGRTQGNHVSTRVGKYNLGNLGGNEGNAHLDEGIKK